MSNADLPNHSTGHKRQDFGTVLVPAKSGSTQVQIGPSGALAGALVGRRILEFVDVLRSDFDVCFF